MDHVILLQRLKTSYGISGPVLGWLTCYLSNRTQFVQRGSSRSKPSAVIYGVPHHKARFSDRSCFCFAPQTSLDWRLRMVSMFISMRMTRRCMWLLPYRRCSTTTRRRLHLCGDMSTWMRSNRLQLNTKKTEVLWCVSSRRQDQIPAVPLRIGTDNVMPVSSVRDLGVYLEAAWTPMCP